MLRSLMEVKGYKLEGKDGALGKVDDFLFDDREWVIRYLVADTGGLYEQAWCEHFGWPYYRVGAGVWGAAAPVGPATRQQAGVLAKEVRLRDAHLRSAREVLGYRLNAKDGEIGSVDDFIVADRYWRLLYLVVDTRRLLPGGKVLVATDWFSSVDWAEREVVVDLSVESIKTSPSYDPTTPINREYERRLYDFYGRPVRWERDESWNPTT